MVSAAITGIGTAFPPPLDQRSAWEHFFSSHHAGSRIAPRIWGNAGVERRHAVADAAVARDKVGLLLCVELTSLHLQPATDDVDQIVAHAIFSDAAAAVAVHPSAPGLEVVGFAAFTDSAA
ncbi:MAG: hypothetical protein M3N33_00190, partial [Actinomycetota bacterium]|nr:hypothetical protein [Actinomycetota bacterium]